MSQGNCGLAQRFLFEVMEQQQLEQLSEICSAELSYRSPRSAVAGLPALKRLLREVFQAFPDLSAVQPYYLSDDKYVVVRAINRGTHRGEYAGIPASGRRLTLPMIYLFQFSEGKIFDIEVFFDVQTLVSQICSQTIAQIR